MHVALFVVNYHADEHLVRLLESVEAGVAALSVDLQVHVLDNSCRSEAALDELGDRLRSVGNVPVAVHSTGRNTGYFGVLQLAQSLVGDDVDVVIYCNPDLLFEPTFFGELAEMRGVAGILAPSVVEIGRGVSLNPVSYVRLSARKLSFLKWIYSSQTLYSAYVLAGWLKELLLRRSRAAKSAEPRRIYVAHGSVFVFTDVSFFQSLPPYPCFLFGEELFIAEEARLRGVETLYAPSLGVRNVRHASISLLPKGKLRQYSRSSVSFILERYYDRPLGLRS